MGLAFRTTMNKLWRFLPATILVLLSIQGCGTPCNRMDFDPWKQADHIVVRRTSNIFVKNITDTAVIKQTAEFAQARRDGWSVGVGGTRIPEYNLDFYSGEHFLGHLGVGKTFIESQGCDDFVERKLSSSDQRLIFGLLDLAQP
jgi:hypothetical protein